MNNREQIERYLDLTLEDDKSSFYYLREKNTIRSYGHAYKKSELLDLIINKEDTTELYLSLNGFCTEHSRKSEYCRQINGVFIDLDSHSKDESAELKNLKTDRAYMLILDAVHNGELLAPTFIVSSGRGLHLYYIYEKSIPTHISGSKKNTKGIACHRSIQNILFSKLKELLSECECALEVDSTKDIPRLSRIPGTYNSKSKTLSEIVFISGVKYSFEDFGLVKKENQLAKKKFHRAYNANSISTNRIELLNALLESRNYCLDGCRHYFLFAYYNSALQIHGRKAAAIECQHINNSFVDGFGRRNPISDTDFRTTIRCIDNNKSTDAEKKSYEGYYKIKDEWLYEKLLITDSEKETLNVIKMPGKREQEKAQRKNKKEERNTEIIRLAKAGAVHSAIAKQMKLSLKTVQNVLKEYNCTRGYTTAA